MPRLHAFGRNQLNLDRVRDSIPPTLYKSPTLNTLRGQTPCSGRHPILVKPSPGCWLAILLLLTAGTAAGQVISAPSTEAFAGNVADHQSITGRQRLRWFVKSTVGPQSLASGMFTAGLGTARNSPREYGSHWGGFGERYGTRLSGVATSNAIQAAMGTLWGEDPRYFRATGQPFKGRIKNVVVMTFAARQPDGDLAPAYARHVGNVGGNFLSNAWRADSHSGVGDAFRRAALGIAGKMGSNAFAEFWPSIRKHLFHRK